MKTNEITINSYVYHRHYEQDFFDENDEKKVSCLNHVKEENMEVESKVDFNCYMHMVTRLFEMFKQINGLKFTRLVLPFENKK